MIESSESIYCLWKHLKSFHGQSMENKKADFGEPCLDCKYWSSCRGDWISKVGNIKPPDLEFSVVHREPQCIKGICHIHQAARWKER